MNIGKKDDIVEDIIGRLLDIYGGKMEIKKK
jgi:hypothetical protein